MESKQQNTWTMPRRDFLKRVGIAAAGVSVASNTIWQPAVHANIVTAQKEPATVMGAFIYPPSQKLENEGYYSWPGSSFDAEGRQKQYMIKINEMQRRLGLRIQMNDRHLDEEPDVTGFINQVKQQKPDGLLLIPFKKSHFEHVVRIIDETNIPTVVLATLGILLVPHVRQLSERTGVYMINSPDNFDAVADGIKMIRTGRFMKDGRLINIDGAEVVETNVPVIGTLVRKIPHQRFYDLFARTKTDDQVKALADQYRNNAREIVQPTKDDILDAARSYFVLKNLIEAEQADAVMMNCLPGLRLPHQHVPPCMGFMSLRDQGIPMGCESDLDATLTMMILQQLCDRPGFQHNPSVDTEKNHYFCAHCTSASKMRGVDTDPEPYMLMSHAEAGWGCVPRVLFSRDQEVTIAKYLSSRNGEKPRLLLYSGTIIGCPPIPPTGGCRTNAETTINELERVFDLQGHHLVMIYDNHVKKLKRFCQLYDIDVVV